MTRLAGWRGKVLLAAVSVSATVAITAVFGETALRYRERNRATVPGTMPQLYYQHNRLPHALVRNYDYYGWVHINAQGFRGKSTPPRRDGVRRIMVVGGSTSFDTFVTADSLAWPAQLEMVLNEADPGIATEVINAGVPGYRVIDNLIRLQTELLEFEPGLIILYHAHNDLGSAFRQGPAPDLSAIKGPFRPGELPTVTPWRRWFNQHSMLYTKVIGRMQAIRFTRGSPPRAPATAAPVDRLGAGEARFERDLRLFIATANTLGIEIVIPEVVHISGATATDAADAEIERRWRATVPSATTSSILDGYRRFNHVLRRVAEETGVGFLETAQLGIQGADLYAPGDPVHFNDAGAERMARGIADGLTAYWSERAGPGS